MNSKYSIVVEDDVWIGYGTVILSGSHIGKDTVNGVCSVVAKDIPPYSVYIDYRIVKQQFENDIFKKITR